MPLQNRMQKTKNERKNKQKSKEYFTREIVYHQTRWLLKFTTFFQYFKRIWNSTRYLTICTHSDGKNQKPKAVFRFKVDNKIYTFTIHILYEVHVFIQLPAHVLKHRPVHINIINGFIFSTVRLWICNFHFKPTDQKW